MMQICCDIDTYRGGNSKESSHQRAQLLSALSQEHCLKQFSSIIGRCHMNVHAKQLSR